MTTNKKTPRMTLAERDAAALAAEPVAETEPAAAPAKAQASPGANRPPKSQSPAPAEQETAKVEHIGIQNWKPVSARVHPRVRASFNSHVNQRKQETGGGAREVMTEALNAYFLTIPAFDDYTRELHERAEAEAALAKRRR